MISVILETILIPCGGKARSTHFLCALIVSVSNGFRSERERGNEWQNAANSRPCIYFMLSRV